MLALPTAATSQSSSPSSIYTPDQPTPVHQHDQPIYTGFNYFRNGSSKFIDVNWFKGGGFLFFKSEPHPVYPATPEVLSDVRWAGVTNQYFTTICTPLADERAMIDEQIKTRGVSVWAKRSTISDEDWRGAGHVAADAGERAGVDGAIGMAGFTLQPGQTITRQFSQSTVDRANIDGCANWRTRRPRSWSFGMFGIVSKTLLNSMNYASRASSATTPAAIVVLTLIIKLLMWPLQNKATLP